MQKSISLFYSLSRIHHYYGKIIFVTVFGTVFVPGISLSSLAVILMANLSMTVFFFSFNDVEDYQDDAKNKEKAARNPIVQKKISSSRARLFSFTFLIASLLFYLSLGKILFYIGLFLSVLCHFYSWKKVRLKSMPVIDLVSHGLYHALIFISSTLVGGNSPNWAPVLSVAFLLLFLSALVDFESDIRDYKVDKRAKIKNTVSKLNIRKTGPVFSYFSTVPVVLIGIFVFLNITPITRAILLFFSALAAYHYLFVWKRKNKFVYYYPYGQVILLFFSFIIAFFN